MKLEKITKTILTWLPSIVIVMFYIPNAIDKIVNADKLDKVITNSTIIMSVGIILLIAALLFLINKTVLWGTAILALYMACVVVIHMYKGKPYEVVILIGICTVFAAYLRKPKLFHQQ